MNWKSHFGMAAAMLAAWFALGVSTTARAEYDTVMQTSFLETTGFSGDGPDPAEWDYSFAITPSSGMKSAIGSASESSFPILVRLSESAVSGFKYSDFSQADYSDLVFVDAKGGFLDYEVELWDANGTSLVWVRVPTFAADTVITCRYGGPSYSHTPAKTWRKFAAVVHGGAGTKDSSANSLAVTLNATTETSTGLVGGGLAKAANKSIGFNLASPVASLSSSSKYSLMAWYKRDGNGGGNNGTHILAATRPAWSSGSGFVLLQEKGQYVSISSGGHFWSSGNDTLADKTWGQVAFTYDNGVMLTSYVNGKKDQEKASVTGLNPAASAAAYWTFGSYQNTASDDSFKGEMDELRVYDGVASAEWIAADYYQMLNAGSLVFGSVVKPDPDMPQLRNCTAVANTNGNILVSGLVKGHSGNVTVTLKAEGRSDVVVDLGTVESGDEFEREIGEDDGLVRFVSYTVSVVVANGEKKAGKAFDDPIRFGKVVKRDFDSKFTVEPSQNTKDLLGSSVYADFPVLVRVPAAASALLRTGSGRDVMVVDQDDNELAFDMETVDSSGVSYLWVKVPALSASTKLTVYVGGYENQNVKAVQTWTSCVGVWHFAPSSVGSTTAPDATASGLDGTSAGGFSAYLGPWGNTCLKAVNAVKAADYDILLDNVAVFSVSGWIKMPDFGGGTSQYMSLASKKTGLTWNVDMGWYLQMNQSKTTVGLVLTDETTYTSLSDITTNWHYFQVVSDGSKVKVYFDGNTSPAITKTYTVKAAGVPFLMGGSGGCVDEYRLRKTAFTAAEMQLEYKTMKDENFFGYSELSPVDPTAPRLGDPVIVNNGDGTYGVSVTIDANMPQAGSVKLHYRDGVYEMTTTDTAVPAVYTADFTPAGGPVTESVDVTAKSTAGTTRRVTSTGFYAGGLKMVKICDATEKGLSNGIVRVSRADTAFDLPVKLEILPTSTASVDTNYLAFALETVIPAGTNSADVVIRPLMDLERAEDTWIDLAFAAGPYTVDETKSSAHVVIVNYDIPTGGNFWCAAAPGKASDAANWTAGVPDEFSAVVFDGDISNADCDWDLGATQKVKSWTQSANYSGTVTLATTFDATFPKLTVSGDMVVLGGSVTHRQHNSTYKVDWYRLGLDIGGMLVVGPGASISARGLGSYGPRSEGESCYGGGYNGNPSWGSLTEPNAVGSSANDNGTYKCRGGGAIWIEVAGTASVNGSINANGLKEAGAWDTHAGSGGSVYLKCAKLIGSGRISAKCENTARGSNARSGAGGRISVLLTEGELDGFAYTQFDACAGYVSYSNHGGTGTVLVRSPEKPNGILYLRDSADKYGTYGYRVTTFSGRLTDIPANASWTLDGIVFGSSALLRVPAGTSLDLPNGLDSVTSDSSDINCGLIVDDGQLFLPEADQTMSGKWTLTTRNEEPVVEIYGGLKLKNGANLGSVILNDSRIDNTDTLPLYGKCLLTIHGDLSVDASSTLYARQCGLQKDKNTRSSGGFKGVLNAHVHGGRAFYNKGIDSQERMYTSYDSVFAPCLPGNSAACPSGQYTKSCGGVISLTVDGKFTMNGKADVSGDPDTMTTDQNGSGGTGGSIDITAGSLAGSGSFLAEGGGYSNLSGPGGRIAIKLTEEGADFSGFKGKISTSGRLNSSTPARSTSSGTIFLRTGDDIAQGGTIRIAMSAGNRSTANPSSTELLSLGYGGDRALDYKGLALELCDFGFGAVNTDLQMSSLNFVDGDSRLDLEGHTLTVGRAWFCGSKVSVGTFKAGDDPFGTLLVDSVGGGQLRVTGYGIWVFIQ